MCEAYLHGTEREIHEAVQEKGNYQYTFITTCVYFGYLRGVLTNYTIESGAILMALFTVQIITEEKFAQTM